MSVASALPLASIHLSAWEGNSRKSAYGVVHITPPRSPKARSSTEPHLMIDSYILWCWIVLPDRECFTATVALNRITHVSCEALHPPEADARISAVR
jgi:hypothetical protein